MRLVSTGTAGVGAQTTHRHAHSDIVLTRVGHAHEEPGVGNTSDYNHRQTARWWRLSCTRLHIRTIARRQRCDRSQHVEARSLTHPAYYYTIYARTAFILSARRTAGRHRCRPCMIHYPIQPRTLQHATVARPRRRDRPSPPTLDGHTQRLGDCDWRRGTDRHIETLV